MHALGEVNGCGGQLFTEAASANVLAASLGPETDPRLCHIITSLVSHLHDLVKDVELTDEEWEVQFLTATGQSPRPPDGGVTQP